MNEIARITFYNITNCGLYEKGADRYTLANISETFEDLSVWIKSRKKVGDTKTFDADFYSGTLPVYAVGLAKQNKNFLFSTWNETSDEDGTSKSLNLESEVGNVEIEESKVSLNYRTGYATYFWIIPEKSIFATITFGTRLNGQKGMSLYLRNFLSTFSIFKKTDATKQIVGYNYPSEKEALNLFAKFDTKRILDQDNVDYVKKRVKSIRKIIRKKTLNYELKKDRQIRDMFFQLVNLEKTLDERDLSYIQKIRYEIDFIATEDDIDYIHRSLQDELDDDYSNAGFMFTGEDKIQWLSKSILTAKEDISVSRDQYGIINGENLLNELELIKPRLLDSLPLLK